MISLRRLADVQNPKSLSNRMRSRRFKRFESLAERFESPLSIIDVGGTESFWQQRGWAGSDNVRITLINLRAEHTSHQNICSVAGDATDLSEFSDRSFDIAFSNSVIEHLFTREAQMAMATEMRRVANAYWVQTPNFWFPIEPHFLFPAWHWLPVSMRAAIVKRRRIGQRGPYPDGSQARQMVEEIRLLKRSELRDLFPEANIIGERFGGLVKSWVCYGGFPQTSDAGRT